MKEAARAFTGWSFRRQRDPEIGGASATFAPRAALHDDSAKTVLGKTLPRSGTRMF